MEDFSAEINETIEWARAHAYEPHIGSPVEGYKGFGVNLQVPKKADLEDLIRSREHAKGLDVLVGSYGVFLIACLDEDTEFTLNAHEAQLGNPKWSLGYHVDLQGHKIKSDNSNCFDPAVWTHGTQGLYQQPTMNGRPAATLIAPTQNVSAAMRTIEQGNCFLRGHMRLLDERRLPHTDINRILAWDNHCARIVHADTEERVLRTIFEKTEQTNQAIFAQTENAITVDWADPRLSRGGMMALWDAGLKGSAEKPLVHTRRNSGIILPTDRKNLGKIRL